MSGKEVSIVMGSGEDRSLKSEAGSQFNSQEAFFEWLMGKGKAHGA